MIEIPQPKHVEFLLDEDLGEVVTAGSLDQMKSLFEKALWKACELGHLDIVDYLLNSGVSHSKCDSDGRGPMHHACRGGHIHVVRRLLEAGVAVNYSTLNESPLHLAIISENTDLVKLLLSHGAKVNFKCVAFEDSKTKKAVRRYPMYYAVLTENLEVLKMLRDAGASFAVTARLNTLQLASAVGDIDMMTYLLGLGQDVNCLTKKFNESLLSLAVSHSSYGVVPFLIESGCDVNIGDDRGITPLYMIIRDDFKNWNPTHKAPFVELLLTEGARYDMKTNIPHNGTPLDNLISAFDRKNDLECFKLISYFIKHGAKVSTWIDEVFYWGSPIKLLFEHFASHKSKRTITIALLRLILATGYPIQAESWIDGRTPQSKHETNLLGWLKRQQKRTRTLQELGVVAVRDAMAASTGNRTILANIQKLEIPLILKDMLSFKDITHLLEK